MGNLVTDHREARALLRLGPYERWQVECIANLLKRHDDRVAAEKRLRIGRRTSATMLALQDAGRRVSSVNGSAATMASSAAKLRERSRPAKTGESRMSARAFTRYVYRTDSKSDLWPQRTRRPR